LGGRRLPLLMPYPPRKEETYVCTGGINQKVSKYILPDTEFLNLVNVDFRVMGALSSFAGSTQYSLTSVTGPITGVAGFFATLGSTPQVIASDTSFLYDATGGTFTTLMQNLIVPGSFVQKSLVLAGGVTSGGALFGAGSRDYFTYQGSTASAWQFSLGKPARSTDESNALSGGTAGLQNVVVYYSLVRQDGLYGPARAITYSAGGATLIQFRMPSYPNTWIGLTGSPVSVATSVSLGSFGLSGIQMWVQAGGGQIYQYGSLFGFTTGIAGFSLSYGFTGASFFAPGSSYQPSLTYIEPRDYQGAFIYGIGVTQGGVNSLAVGSAPTSTQNPQCIEYYANRLFSAIGSRVFFSNAGEPEVSDYGQDFYVSRNDPTYITSMKAYFTQMVIWKFGTTWALSGDGPDTFNLIQCSPIYGCIAPNAACVWEQKLWFLDSKGICEFNGANTGIVSDKMEETFKTMNVGAAVNVATMIHVKERSEVWCGIPVNGATMINLIVVYDYDSDAWATRTVTGENFSFLASFNLGANKQKAYYGSYSGMIGSYGSSLIGDNGAAATCVIKSRFFAPNGNSVENMFRRLYLDATVPAGQTHNILVNLYADKETTPYYSVTMSVGHQAVGQCNNRIDFGVPAKSMAVEFIFSEYKFLQLNGFTIESRFQRNV